MTPDPFLRRHGHGAARLAIGSIEGGLSLGRLAARPVVLEGLAARLPASLCVLAALLLGWRLSWPESVPPTPAPIAGSTDAEGPLAIRIWREPRAASLPRPVSPPIPSEASKPTGPRTTDVSESPAQPASAAAGTPTPSPSSPSSPRRTPFDPRSLTLRPSRAATLPAMSAPLPPVHPAERGESERPLARAAREPVSLRNAFLASVSIPESLPSPADPEAPAPTPRPPVSAAAHDAGLADSIRSELERWDEVPLEDLPDCTPSGRQDALKQRILRSVPLHRECSHAEGRYRFVQMRNLNAFLMWSRPNPDAPAHLDVDRDACDVLERALRCLGDPTHEEISIR